ncbi:MAG: hypothetical protein U1C74_33230 [Phenylobacterium sp.]|mgnify:CR=1 FL=1|uniref:SPOR domain-containing protein n=1 Tax=Brevundimonas mediterranea TaxID=74329 RepID=A0AB37E633_9CAUL|nr:MULTISPECIES: hypothetical protein [Brevundimonas]MDZ4376272.1 hypothetical protein [Phenylobacterium sp.]OYX74283.1 MAG: hypothetical protein B7Y85_12810 [Brevundimonas sp. 32-68-21]EDX81067.1 hypothetical protein BBAL3_2224 [Brevundimonas sp. BAL3]MBA4332357.1 hypothetical protein [Brevundimonas sp.]QIH72513.1 hypothetical protein GYM46_05850 [Brevundimonas mediterranea]
MIRSFLAATAALSLSTAVQAQTAAPAQVQPAEVALLPGAQLSPDCGGLNNLTGRAWCVTAPLGQVGALADAFIADLATKGWLAAGGDENRVVFVKRREAGGCDGMQMVAFYDTTKTAVAELPAYLGFAVVPGDVCAQPAAEKPASETTPQ